MAHGPANDDLDVQTLMQAAMSAYVDEAMKKDHAHDRLVRASRAAALAVVGQLRDAGHLRPPLQWEPVHGTRSGYADGCRCDFCRDAEALYNRAKYHWQKAQGHNKVREAVA